MLVFLQKVAEELTGNSIPTINAAKGIIGTSFQEYFDSAGQTANTFKGYVACFQVYDRCLRSHEVKVTMMCLNQHSKLNNYCILAVFFGYNCTEQL